MRTTILAFFFLKVLLLALIVAPVDVACGDETESQSIEVSLNLGEIIDFAQNNDDFALILQRAIQEATDGARIQNLDDAINAANEVVGMDIRTDAHSLNLNIGSGFSLKGDWAMDVAPIHAVLHTAELGNLEGLLLMAPNYSSEKSGGGTTHVMQVGPKQNVYLKFIESSSGVFTVAAMNQDHLNAVGKKLSRKQLSPSDLNSDELLRASVGDETFEMLASELSDANAPQANIVRNIISDMSELTLVVSRKGDGVSIDLTSTLNSKDKAKQQYQAMLGGKAIAKMFLESENSNSKVEKLVEILDSLEIEQDGATVNASLTVPSVTEAMKLIEEF